MNTSPNVTLQWKGTLDLFPLDLSSNYADGDIPLANAQWVLEVSSGLQYMETYSLHVLLSAEAFLGKKTCSFHTQGNGEHSDAWVMSFT